MSFKVHLDLSGFPSKTQHVELCILILMHTYRQAKFKGY